MKKSLSKIISFSALALIMQTGLNAQGTWTQIANAPNYNMGVMLLMTDGTVISKDDAGGNYGTGWNKLTPDIHGSYINGTWSSIAAMNNDRLFFPTQVLVDGKVFAAGGEYSSGSGSTSGEVYDPVTNKWNNTNGVQGGMNIFDGNSEILANGSVLVGLQAGPNNGQDNQFYTESTNNWSNAPQSPLDHDEAQWLKLPDGSILFVGIGTTQSCRYIPSTNTWVNDANLPVNLYDPYGSESGAALMLPNGKAIFFGATGHNAIYTPSGNTSPGSWAAAADFPTISGNKTGQIDAPAAMETCGKILCAVSPVNTSSGDQFRAPTWFVTYDYTTNTFAQETAILPGLGADSLAGIDCDFVNFLLLPDGSILLGINQQNISNQYWIYTPSGTAIAAGKPTISSITETSCGTYRITGKLFNGISEGTAFGDDWQMSTNYPIIRLTDGTNVYYAKTSKWNRIGAVRTDSLKDTATFVVPNIPAGTYSLVVVANGFPSNPTLFTPFAATAQPTAEVTCNGDKNGNATAVVSGGTSPYTYKWANGSSTVSTSNPTGAILSAGTYTLTVTDHAGCTTTTTVSITQPSAINVYSHINANVSCHGESNGSATCTPSGGSSPYTYSWSGGGTGNTKTGLSAGVYTITVTDNNGCTGTGVTTAITQPAAFSLTPGTFGTTTGNCDGTGWVIVSGGTKPYTYSWSPGGFTTDTIHSQCNNTYCCKITDKNGCIDSACVTIVTGIQNLNNTNLFTIYPNPNNGTFTIQSSVVSDKSSVEVYNVLGEQVLNQNITCSSNQINLDKQPSGVYLYRILSESGKVMGSGKFVIQK